MTVGIRQNGGYLRTGREPALITERDPISGPMYRQLGAAGNHADDACGHVQIKRSVCLGAWERVAGSWLGEGHQVVAGTRFPR